MAKPESTPKASSITTQMLTTAPNTTMNLEKGNPSQESSSSNNPLPLENVPTHEGTPWPGVGSMLGNLFKLRKDWPISPTFTSNPPVKIEPQSQEAVDPHAIITPKVEKCGWGPNCPICKNIENEEEDWNSDKTQQNIPCAL